MSRRSSALRREVKVDPRFRDPVVAEFVACLMKSGKRSTSERMLYSAIDATEKKSGNPGLDVFYKALNNVKPVLEVKSRRVGGATYQVPVEVKPDRRIALAIRWIITYSIARAGRALSDKLAAELLAASNNEGGSIKKKEDTHKMAEANKAFAHFKW
jgi:small subunit ribosomal protein S7